MSNNSCVICLNSGRPVKFTSERIHICQWCVTFLQDVQIIPENIDEYILAKVKKYARKPPVKPKLLEINTKTDSLLRQMASSSVTNQESFFENIANSLFNKKKREDKIQHVFEIYKTEENNLRELQKNENKQIQEKYTRELNKYEFEIGGEINDSCKKFISGEYLPPGMTPKDNKTLKYIRAYKYHLLAGISKLLRPNEEEMAILRKDIKKQDKYACQICSKSYKDAELHVHHIIPLDQYGSNHPKNLITLCHSCHNKQHSGFQVSRNIPIIRKRTGGEFIAFDIETTGFSSNNDHIIELAAVKFKSAQIVDEFCTLINPKIPIPPKIISLTGINGNMVASAPSIDDVFFDFIYFIGNTKLVAHNASFDMRFLNMYAKQFGIKIENEVVDTLQLSRKKIPQLRNHKLQTLVWHFNIKTNGTHRALADSHATAQVYIKCLRINPKFTT